MRFSLLRNQMFIIECHLCHHETQAKDNEIIGYRGEGTCPLIKLKTNQVRFNYVPRIIHPDLIALICIIIFYPFFTSTETINFPEKISANLADELKILPVFFPDPAASATGTKAIKKKIGIFVEPENIDYTLTPYKGKGASVISFGGGIDSLAALSLFPRMTIIHESNEQKDTGVPKLIQKINEICDSPNTKKNYIISTNSKNLTDPPGWTTWISCIATSLLLANELGTTNIVLGSSMGSLLKSCAKFRQNGYEFPQNSQWARLLENTVHIKLVTPLLGLSELALIKIIDNRLLKYAIWCESSEYTPGSPCKQCAKCFRRSLLLADHLNHVEITNWDNYNNLGTHKLLRNLESAGPTLTYLLKKHSKILPNWINRYLLDKDESPQKIDLFAWYHRSLAYIPRSLRTYLYQRIVEKVRPMSVEEMDLFELYYG